MHLTTLGFAVLANAIYFDNEPRVGAFARHLLRRENACGFHAAIYLRPTGGGLEYVLSYAGSEFTEGGVDWQADLGFGGDRVDAGIKILGAASPIVSLIAGLGYGRAKQAFMAQKNNTLAFATLARKMAGRHPLVLTGHSLGGGLAQIAAAHTGLPAVTFSAPSVTAVEGVQSAYRKQRPKIINFRIKNDPVNVSEATGARIGHVVTLMSPRSIADAHQMGNTIAELLPQGQFAVTGKRNPFLITESMLTS